MAKTMRHDSHPAVEYIPEVGASCAPASGFSSVAIIQIATTACCLMAAAGGVKLGGPIPTALGCLLILILGMPHGAFDIRALLSTGTTGTRRIGGLALYIAAGGIMAFVWWGTPSLALALFFVTAIAHFGDDWSNIESPFLSHGAALGLLAAATILHGPMIAELFGAITSDRNSVALVSVLTIVSPVAIAATLVATAILWFDRHREIAVAGLVALAGLLILPPVIGFALFFGLHHSPRHFGKALGPDARATLHRWAMPVAVTSMFALGLVAVIYGMTVVSSPSAGFVRASFVTLSILTVPHMLLSRIIAIRDHGSWPGLRRRPQAVTPD